MPNNIVQLVSPIDHYGYHGVCIKKPNIWGKM